MPSSRGAPYWGSSDQRPESQYGVLEEFHQEGFLLQLRWGGDRKQDKTVYAATATKPSKDSQLLTVAFPWDSSKGKVEKFSESPHPKHCCKGKGVSKCSNKKSE